MVLSFEILVRGIGSWSPEQGRGVNKQERGADMKSKPKRKRSLQDKLAGWKFAGRDNELATRDNSRSKYFITYIKLFGFIEMLINDIGKYSGKTHDVYDIQ